MTFCLVFGKNQAEFPAWHGSWHIDGAGAFVTFGVILARG